MTYVGECAIMFRGTAPYGYLEFGATYAAADYPSLNKVMSNYSDGTTITLPDVSQYLLSLFAKSDSLNDVLQSAVRSLLPSFTTVDERAKAAEGVRLNVLSWLRLIVDAYYASSDYQNFYAYLGDNAGQCKPVVSSGSIKEYNFIKNDNFALGISDWVVAGSLQVTVEPRSLVLQRGDANVFAELTQFINYDAFTGDSVEYSVWAYALTPNDVDVFMRWNGPDGATGQKTISAGLTLPGTQSPGGGVPVKLTVSGVLPDDWIAGQNRIKFFMSTNDTSDLVRYVRSIAKVKQDLGGARCVWDGRQYTAGQHKKIYDGLVSYDPLQDRLTENEIDRIGQAIAACIVHAETFDRDAIVEAINDKKIVVSGKQWLTGMLYSIPDALYNSWLIEAQSAVSVPSQLQRDLGMVAGQYDSFASLPATVQQLPVNLFVYAGGVGA